MEQSITTIPHRRKSFPCMIMKPNTSSMMILSTEDLRPFHFSKKQALKSPQCISFDDTVDTSAFYKEQLLPCHLLSSPCQLFLPPLPGQLIVTAFLQQLKPCVQGPRRSIPELSEAWMSCRAWFGLFSYAVLLKQNILTLTRSLLHVGEVLLISLGKSETCAVANVYAPKSIAEKYSSSLSYSPSSLSAPSILILLI